MYRYILALFLILPFLLSAQNDLAIGQWKSHLPYRQAVDVTQSDERIFYATEWSILALDKVDFAAQFISKVNGLSNVGVERIKYNPFSDILVVVYTDGVIDLLKEKGTISLNAIKNFNNIIGEKRINDLFVEDERMVYLAASYGISKLNIAEEEFVYSTFTGISVESVVRYRDAIYAATEEGIYRTTIDNPFPEDFSTWQRLAEAVGFPQDYSSKRMGVFQDRLFLNINEGLYFYDGNELTEFYAEDDYQIAYFSTEGSNMIVGLTRGTQRQGRLLFVDTELTINQLDNSCVFNPFAAIEDNQRDGFVWFADQGRGFRYAETPDSDCQRLSFTTSPFSHHVRDITVADDEVWVASGNLSPTFSPLFRPDGFFQLKDGRWSEYNRNTPGNLRNQDIWDFMQVVVHPDNQTVYAAAFIEGLIEWDREEFTIYDDSNSSLNNAIGDINRTRVSGLIFDEQNNLWIANYSAERPISVFTDAGEWQSFSTASCQSENTLLDPIVDPFGYKWFVTSGNNAGILVYDSGIDPLDPDDDRCRLLTTNNTELPTNQVNTIIVDTEGSIWVGTSKGVAVSQGFDPFEDNFDFFLPKTDQDANNLGLLLSTEEVRTIAVDGANRKWFGTSSGIFVQSADGTEQLARFTSENSPLFDNTILDIAIDPKNGEVYIGTTKGLLSYRGEATEGGFVNSFDAYAYPNPVRPEYTGPIAITGLAANANVKITDVHGQLIFETTALGGQAIWDGTDYNGRRASSGVYLVFATSDNNFQPDAAVVAKILVMK
ncbi:MAG: two-component regulator propeller domain-containing protein [Bacteroidota bacterium]